MTIASQTFRFEYVSTGGTTYQYTNKIIESSDLTVYVDDVLKTEGSDYSVTGVGEAAGGNVVFGTAPTAGAVVLITKDGVQFTQDTDYVENDSFPAEAHEDALDKLTNLCQKIWDYTRRSVKLPIYSSLTDLVVPDGTANAVIGWDSTGSALENKILTSYGLISDSAYSSSWNGQTTVAPSQNAVYDIVQSTLTSIPPAASDTAYASTWDGVTTIPPSKNAVYDKIEAMISDSSYSSAWDGVTTIAPSKNAVYDKIEALAAGYPPGHIYGMEMSNADANYLMSFSAGSCRDSTDTADIDLATAITKTTNSTWVAGDGNGAVFAGGTAASATHFHVFAIKKDSDGSVDVGISTSITAADKPAGYTYYRRLGSIWTEVGNSKPRQFLQSGDDFRYKSPTLDINDGTASGAKTLAAVPIPNGLKVKTVLNFVWTPASTQRHVYVSDPDSTDLAPVISANAPLSSFGMYYAVDISAQVEVMSNTSNQIAYRTGEAGRPLYGVVIGWTDKRGR